MAKKEDKDLQKVLTDMIDWEDFKKAVRNIDNPISKVNAYLGILPYVLPKLQSVSQDITTKQQDAMGALLDAMSSIPKEN